MKKLNALLLLLFMSGSVNAAVFGNEGPEIGAHCDDMPDNPLVILCILPAFTTTTPTILVADNDSLVLTAEGVEAIIIEVQTSAENAPASQELASHFETSVESIQLAVATLLDEGDAVTVESIGSKLQ